jgi:chemotaxis protein MotB
MALVASACGVDEDLYKRDVGNLKDQIAQLRSEGEQLGAEKRRCLEDYAALAKEKGNLSGSLSEALRKIEELKAVAAKRKEVLDRLAASLQEMVAAGKITVVKRNGRLVVQIAENILFDTGKSKLKPDGEAAIAELAPLLAAAGRNFQVAGHTDNQGAAELNWKLSTDRALSVLFKMIESGYPPERLSPAGFAFYQPVATNDSPEGRQLNRRVEIVLVPNLDELEIPEFSDACNTYFAQRGE